MSIKKFKTLFLITLIIDLLATIPLVLVSFNPTMMNEMVYSQFPGINEAGKEALDLFHFVFGLIAISMIVALIVALRIKIKESAQTAALILFIFLSASGIFASGFIFKIVVPYNLKVYSQNVGRRRRKRFSRKSQ